MVKTIKHFNWTESFSLKSLLYTLTGAFFVIVAFQGFMIPNHFMDGGITGISLLLHEVFHINVAIPLLILNIPFLFIGYKKIGGAFALHSLLALIIVVVLIQFIEIPAITDDKVLIAVFGGFFIGLGLGLIIKAGGVLDGLEVIAVYTNKNSRFSTSEIVMVINTVIFITAATLLGIEIALYSIITFFTALQFSNYVVDGFDEYTSMNIVSKKPETIKPLLVQKYGKAITVYKGERGYLPKQFSEVYECDIIVTVVTRLEIFNIQNEIYTIDPDAFIYIQRIKEVKGGVVKLMRKH